MVGLLKLEQVSRARLGVCSGQGQMEEMGDN